MVTMMINFSDRSLLVVVIERENLDRMRKADPITLESFKHGGLLPVPEHPDNFSVIIAYEEDDAELYRMARGPLREFVRWLERERRWNDNTDGKKNAFKLPERN